MPFLYRSGSHPVRLRAPTNSGQERYLVWVLRDPLRQFFRRDYAYELAFDRFEYLLALLQSDLREEEGSPGSFVAGRWAYKMHGFHRSETHDMPSVVIDEELASEGKRWPPFQDGLFGSDMGRLRRVKAHVDASVKQRGFLG